MSLFDKAKQIAQSAFEITSDAVKTVSENTPNALQLLDSVKQKLPETIPLCVSEAQLNQMVTNAISDEDRIKALTLTCDDNILTVHAVIKLAGSLAMTAKTQLAIEHCELSQTRKVIIMRRLDQTELGGTGIASSLLAHVVKLVVCGLFSVDIGAFSLRNIDGLSIDKEIITADLEAMGAIDAINKAINNKINMLINPLLKTAIESLLPSLTQKIIDKIVIEDLLIDNFGIRGVLRLVAV